MKLYVVRQSSKLTESGKVFAGTRVLAKVTNLIKDVPLNGDNKLELELPIELPDDLLEYHVKLADDSKPVIFYDFKMTGQFTASVRLHIPTGWTMNSPSNVILYAVTPILMRGVNLPDQTPKYDAVIIDTDEPLPKKTNKRKKKEKK
jgi:hypothetical protein